MDTEERSSLEELLREHQRRLRTLEVKAARLGPNTPLEDIHQIEDITAKIAGLVAQLGTAPSVLPDYTFDFVGRATEIATLAAALRQAAGQGRAGIAGIHGMGGVGKTQLALNVALSLRDVFPDAQILLDLRGTSDTPMPVAHALQTVIRVFTIGATLADDPAKLRQIYLATLAGKRVLILADDAEDADQILPLVPPPGCALLITSRQLFPLSGAAVEPLALGRLDETAATALIQTICPRVGDAAPELARLCGYLPLALRVSASLLAVDATKQPATFLQELASEQTRLAKMTVPYNSELDLEASLELGYQALGPAAQTMLRQLGVFPASFDLDAVRAVVKLDRVSASPPARASSKARNAAQNKPKKRAEAEADAQPLDHKDVLNDLYLRSWVEYDTLSRRYMLHDVVRSFTIPRLTNAEQRRFKSHARHYLSVLRAAGSLYNLGGEHQFEALRIFDRERIHIDVGRNWARTHKDGPLMIGYLLAARIIDAFRYHQRHERLPYALEALAHARRLKRRDDEMEILYAIGGICRWFGEHSQANQYYQRALAIAIARNQRLDEARILSIQMEVLTDLGKPRQAIDNGNNVRKITREVGGGLYLEGTTLGSFGRAYFVLGEMQHAIAYYEQALDAVRQEGELDEESTAQGELGRVYIALGDAEQALTLCEQALQSKRALGDRHNESMGLHYLGLANMLMGNIVEAYSLQEQALIMAQEATDGRLMSLARNALGELALYEGDLPRAAAEFTAAIEYAEKLQLLPDVARANWNLGLVHEQQGALERAIELMQVRVDYERKIRHTEHEQHAAYLELLRQKLAPIRAEESIIDGSSASENEPTMELP
jgi:tetratricopeptide (TPR) repeat protein